MSCRDLARSRDWYGRLFGRAPDAEPMAHLAEWHHGPAAGMQLFEDADAAGHSTLTVITPSVAEARAAVASRGIDVTEIESGRGVTLMRLADPDDNLVVLAEGRRG